MLNFQESNKIKKSNNEIDLSKSKCVLNTADEIWIL
jgi:hypothetical protein